MTDGPARIACFGDSLTQGYGLARDEALPASLERLLHDEGIDVRCLNFGMSGDTFGDGLARIDAVLAAEPDAVILEFGANDCFEEDPVDIIRSNAELVIKTLIQAGLPILLVGITALPELGLEYKRQFDPLFKELADRYSLPLFPDILACYFGDNSLTLLDGIHPNAQGVIAVAQKLLPQVRELILTAQTRD
ncbi:MULTISPECIES: arylesterase [unclassified Pseudodesulfovibrio]|uniref:arylesterase n=1 Tax=unclassified Pseudodesulfovibrio TaxID=2661612 RepID=UPI000FEB784C|nr:MULTISPECIES: arylesterase [unclassified Pseudodesulfovibrio]MCJ2164110.1 arylesterase [Pseudodesulfovibrio sp. S3-i]RWU05260.1 arylesterase [Pseudodesulfovibrio sp. S3]